MCLYVVHGPLPSCKNKIEIMTVSLIFFTILDTDRQMDREKTKDPFWVKLAFQNKQNSDIII